MRTRSCEIAPLKTPMAVFAVTGRGLELAKRLPAGAFVYAPPRLKGGRLKGLVKDAFERYPAVLFICASGIAVRSIAPFIKGKETDPAVLVMDDGGGFVISLLSGHLGGANRLAKEIAALYGATPVITTATDVMGLPCAEDIAERFSLRVEDAGKIKRVNSALLNGGKVLVIDADGARRKKARGLFGGKGPFSFASRLPAAPGHGGYAAFVAISPFVLEWPASVKRKTLVLRPVEFTLGVGCRRGVSEKEVGAAVKKTLAEAGVSPLSVRNIATIDIKSDEAGLTGFAAKAGLHMEFYTARELNAITPPSGRSLIVEQKTGAAGVSEPAALLSSGAKRLWIRKKIYKRVTVAAARVPSP